MKILVVDDHALIRQALHNMLGQLDASPVVLGVANCEAALATAADHPDLDLVLLDLNLPGMGGLEALQRLRCSHPAVPIVVLSGVNDRPTVLAVLDKGAMGFIPKSSTNEVMLSALRLVLAGGVYLPQEVLERDCADGVSGVSSTGISTAAGELGLTGRQIEVLVLLLQGKSNKVICRELGLAEGTVKVHVTAVLKALKVTTRTQALVAASRMTLCIESPVGSWPER